MRVLIVEDDRALGLFLQKGLKLEGHDTAWVENGEAALAHIREQTPDLIVLDLTLPGCDGVSVLEALRELSIETSVLVLTGRTDVNERVRCLNLGADDCLLKPFSFHELAARCRAILRRQRSHPESVLRYGSLEVDLMRRKASCNQMPLDLTAREFAVLETLVRRRGGCCSREELLQEVWQIRPDTATNVVDVYVNYLRKKLAGVSESSSTASRIETVRGCGYRLSSEVSCRKQSIGVHESALALGA